MHERTSRAMARLLFVACCAMPTLLTLAVIIVCRSPWYHRSEIRALESNLEIHTGLDFQIGDFHRAAPDRIELSDVQLRHPETGRPVLDLYRVTWQRNDQGTVIRIVQPKLHHDQISAAWYLIHDRYLCQSQHTQSPTTILVDGLTVGDFTFRDIDAQIVPHPQTVEVIASAVPASGNGIDDIIEATVMRDRSSLLPSTNWWINTNTAQLPCRVLSDFIPWMKRLGDSAQFAGMMALETGLDDMVVDLSGARFSDIDLATFAENLPHRMGGTAEIRFDRCVLQSDQRHDIAGQITCDGGGFIAATLLTPLADQFGVQIDPQWASQRDVGFDRFSAWFEINGRSMQATGNCNRIETYLPPDVLASVGGRPLLMLPPTGPLDSAALAYLAAPLQSPMVPLTQATRPILKWLQPGAPEINGGSPAARLSRVRSLDDGSPAAISQPR
ncbi:hypothetical protein Pan14r_33830 [Crateriforma conspicua]|uniref:AsmA-like C-terminal domain-containing protein n=2 Tax=Crateriforma conspicua TaxID=2527996 RepID=A0A5C5Y8D1_9PLAN|nr:hypothetical protein Pan14r_33830 [Crateriforma conspicua]